MMVTVRPEQLDDIGAVRALNGAAFGQSTEGEIVDAIRPACNDTLSLVATDAGEIVGHIFFSPVEAPSNRGTVQGMGLGPMAVRPDRQRQGIGSILVRVGIQAMRKRDCPFIIVLGHPEYYPRFGFQPASQHGLSCQWDGVPDNAFMVLALDQAVVADLSGVVKYRAEFDQAI